MKIFFKIYKHNLNEFNYKTLKPVINANYIFLDNYERKLFTGLSFENLQLFNDCVEFFNLIDIANLETELYHPWKIFIFLPEK